MSQVFILVIEILIFVKLAGGGANNRGNPYSCVCLHGDRKPNERKANLQKFKDVGARFLICTDVAARGIGKAFLLADFYYTCISFNFSRFLLCLYFILSQQIFCTCLFDEFYENLKVNKHASL